MPLSRPAPVLVLLAVLAAPLSAQQGRSDSVARLPDVVRTVSRDPAAVWNFPGALTRRTIDGALKASGRLEDGLSMAPGVLAQSRSGGVDLRITIRGFGARGAGDRSNAGTMRGVRMLVDGFPETEPDGRTSLDLVDLGLGSQLDVLRSNGSAMWGNATGGVVSLSTLPAGANPLTINVSGGSFGLFRTSGSVSMEGRRGIGYLSSARTEQSGWRANSGGKRTIANLGFATPESDRTSLRLHVLGALNEFSIPGPLTAEQLAANPQQANATYLARRERRDNRMMRVGSQLTHHLSSTLSVVASGYVTPKHLERSERGTYRFFDRIHRGGSVMAEQRIAGAGALTAGADIAVQDGDARFWSLTPVGEQGTTLQQDKNEGAKNRGVFLQHEITFGSRLTLNTGARYDAIDYSLVDAITPRLNARKRFSQVTPKVGATFHAGRAHIVYATLGGGIEAPAANEVDAPGTFGQDTVTGINPLLDPIRSTTVEFGTRQVIAPRGGSVHTVSYDIAAYQTKVRNEVVPYRGGRFYFSAGEARRRGLEGSLQAELAGGFGVGAAATLQNHIYTDYVVDSVHYGKAGASADYSGNRVVGVPKTILGAEAHWAPAGINPVRLGFSVQSVGEYYADDANSVVVPRSTIASASLVLTQPLRLGGGIGLSGSVQVNNLFDKTNVASAFLNPDLVGGKPAAFEPGLPRHVVVGLSLGWMDNSR